MKILLTGTTGYIAKRLALQLLEDDHELICCVRDMERIPDEIEEHPRCTFIKVDFLKPELVSFDLELILKLKWERICYLFNGTTNYIVRLCHLFLVVLTFLIIALFICIKKKPCYFYLLSKVIILSHFLSHQKV